MTLLTEPHTPGAGCCHCPLTQELTLHLSPQGSLLAAVLLLEVAVLDAVLYVQYVVLYVHVHSCVYLLHNTLCTYCTYVCTCVYLIVLGICHKEM